MSDTTIDQVATAAEPWRLRCPQGHASLQHRARDDGFYCKRCGRSYGHSPIDAAAVESFPRGGVGR